MKKQIRGGLVATPHEELIKTKTHNQVTFYYIDDQQVTSMKKRKINEEKAILDFFSDREAFNNNLKRIRRGTMIEGINYISKLSDIRLDDFLKFNKIHPKIFSADQLFQ